MTVKSQGDTEALSTKVGRSVTFPSASKLQYFFVKLLRRPGLVVVFVSFGLTL